MKDWLNNCHFGDCIDTMRRMPDGIAQTCITSPPYPDYEKLQAERLRQPSLNLEAA